MAESVNTGGTKTFVYSKGYKPQKSPELEADIKQGYEEYEKRKRGEKIIAISIAAGVIIMIALYLILK